jgi:hypothetical protein
MNREPSEVCPCDVDGRKYEERNTERRDEESRKKERWDKHCCRSYLR